MSGCRCRCGSLRTMLSRRCADDGGGLRLQFPALGLALARAAGDVLAARSRVSVDVPSADLAYTWRGPSTDPGAPGLAASTWSGCRAGRFSRAAARTRSPSARRVAAPPRGQSRHQPQPPAIFRLTTAGPQLRHTRAAAVSDLDPDHASGSPDRDRDRLPCSARAAVPDAVGEQLAHQQRGAILARVPRPGHPGRERAGNPACSARLPSRSPGQPPWPPADPPCPARPAARETTRGRSRAHGDARPARRPASSPGYAAGAARPWPSVKQPTVRTDRDEARIPSAMRPWTPRHVDPQ